jgi:aspartate/methionine/tyrosine aminotransferase
MGALIPVQPDILNIPYGNRHRVLDAARGKKDLADLASGNPERPVPSFIIERLKTSLDSPYMRYTNYYGLPELRQKIAERLKTDCQLVVDPETELLVTNGVQEGLYIVRSQFHGFSHSFDRRGWRHDPPRNRIWPLRRRIPPFVGLC